MAVYKAINKDAVSVTCDCSCGNGMEFIINRDSDFYALIMAMNGNFYRDQNGAFRVLKKKLEKIWCIIRNKDFYYSEVIMSEKQFDDFKNVINTL